jgi:hypothetical protein
MRCSRGPSDRDDAFRAHGYVCCWEREETFHVGIAEACKVNANLPHPDPDEWHVGECVRSGYNTQPPAGWEPSRDV